MHPLVKIAKESVELFIRSGKVLEVVETPELKEYFLIKKACFVTLKIYGKLRGCIGTIHPTQSNLVKEVIKNSISASTNDPRFQPVTLDELSNLTYSVDVLEPMELVSSLDELDPKKYGIYIKSDFRSGLLLPDIEGIDTIEEQLEITKLKAGIKNEDFKIYRFEVIRCH